MLTNTRRNAFADPTLDMADDQFLPEEVLGEDLEGDELYEYDDEGGVVGLGAARRRRRRKARAARRVRGRGRRARGRKGRARRARGRRRARRIRVVVKTEAPKRRRRARRARRKAKAMAGLRPSLVSSGMGEALDGLEGLDGVDGLGAARKRRRKVRRARGRKGRARAGRRPRRGRRRYTMMGFGRLSEMVANLGEVEVAQTMPIVGVVEYLGTTAGLEALGGVTLSSFIYGAVEEGLMKRIFKVDAASPMALIGTALVSGAVMWELGRLLGSGNIAKFGAFYAFGKAIDNALIGPSVVKQLFKPMGYYGQARVPEGEELRGWGFGQARVPEGEELRGYYGLGQARVPEGEELRGLGQVRTAEDEALGQRVEIEEMSDLGQAARVVTEEELLGDTGVGTEEESAIF